MRRGWAGKISAEHFESLVEHGRAGIQIVALAALAASAAHAQSRPPAQYQGPVRVESSAQLFTVMCALHAAGYQSEINSADFYPLRAGLRADLLQRKGPAVDEVRAFYNSHLLSEPSETLSRYISFALVVDVPPAFEYRLPVTELPPDVLTLEGFRNVLRNFYREQNLEQLWERIAPQYNAEIRRLRGPVSSVVAVTAGYLREIVPSDSRRTFTVYVEPLAGNAINFRLYGDQYAIVVSPSPGVPMDLIRHAFLHYLLDPLPLRYRAAVESKQGLLEFAARAPRLPQEYRNDFSAYLTECLVRAVELRLRRLPADQLANAFDDADRNGYLLIRPLYQWLLAFDRSQPSMNIYFPEMMKGIDLQTEARREAAIQFAPADAASKAGSGHAETVLVEASELQRWLDEGDRQIASQDGAGAAATFQRILEKYPQTPRAVYGLAVASVLQGKAEQAKRLFQQLIASSTGAAGGTDRSEPPQDAVIVAWSHVYLGRMNDVEGNRELALSEYRAALAVKGAPESASAAARRGLEKVYTVPTKNRESRQPR